MALIQCSVCGKNISDKAGVCVHCGAEIKICPKCGSAYTGDDGMCRSCYAEHGGDDAARIDAVDYIERFYEQSPKTERVYKKFESVRFVLKKFDICSTVAWLSIILSCVATSGLFDGFLTTETYRALFIMGLSLLSSCAFGLHSASYNLSRFIFATRCAAWLSTNGIDPSEYIKRRYRAQEANGGFAEFDDLYDFSLAAICAQDKNHERIYKIRFAIQMTFGGLFIAFFTFVNPFLLATRELFRCIAGAVTCAALGLTYFVLTTVFTSKNGVKINKTYNLYN